MSTTTTTAAAAAAAAQERIIIFGPTGHVGGAVARSLHERFRSNQASNRKIDDSRIVLAMRDPTKKIRNLQDPGSPMLQRVKADLSDPDSLSSAVRESGATRAFIYLLLTSPDGMSSSLQALKEAGIRFVVFLSSFSIQGPIDEIPQSDIIPHQHAAVEKNLEELFPDAYTTLRPGMFATNTLSWKSELKKGNVSMFQPSIEFDYIAYEDIGAIAAAVLISGVQKKEDKIIPILGPQLISQEKAAKTLGRVCGRKIEVSELDFEGGVQKYIEDGTPAGIARYLARHLEEGNEGEVRKTVAAALREASGNVQRFTGREAIKFEEWCEKNEDLFR